MSGGIVMLSVRLRNREPDGSRGDFSFLGGLGAPDPATWKES